MKSIIGRKIGMTQIFQEDGSDVPVTVVHAVPMTVVQGKTVEKDGQKAIQVGLEELDEKKVNQAKKGHFEKGGVTPLRVLQEMRIDEGEAFETGQEIAVDIFEAGERVDVVGTSKGKGTQGAIKRHNYSRGRETHGSKFHRASGARAAGTYPGRVFPGTKGAGRMGNERVTVQNLEIVRVDAENNMLLIKGAIPGNKNGLVRVTKTVKQN